MSGKLLALVIGLILLLGAGATVLVVQSKKSQAPTPPTTTTKESTAPTTTDTHTLITADTSTEAEASKKRFSAALAKAGEWSLWKSDVTFSGLFISFGPDLALNSANEVYVFDSPTDVNHHYTVSVSQSTGNMLRAIIPVSDYQGTLLPIDSKYWKSSYVEAVQSAYNNGGKSFMGTNQVVAVNVNLRRADPNNYLYWIVTFQTSGSISSKTIKINANDKTIMEE